MLKGFYPECAACRHCRRVGMWDRYCLLHNFKLPDDPGGFAICRKFDLKDNRHASDEYLRFVMKHVVEESVLYRHIAPIAGYPDILCSFEQLEPIENDVLENIKSDLPGSD